MADLDFIQNTYERTVYFYTEEGPTGQLEIDDDLIALVEAAPPSPIADKLKALDLENMLGEDLVLDEHGIDFVDLLSALVVAHPDKLPKIEVEGCFTGDRARPGEYGGFAHSITPTGIRSIDTSSFLAVSPAGFDATKLTDAELSKCLDEMRRRGAAIAIYDVPEILTMTDGWQNQPTEDALTAWFDREHLEEVMCDAARREVTDFIDNPQED